MGAHLHKKSDNMTWWKGKSGIAPSSPHLDTEIHQEHDYWRVAGRRSSLHVPSWWKFLRRLPGRVSNEPQQEAERLTA